MAISYAKVVKNQYIFRQLMGLTTEEFEKIVKKVKPEWEKEKKRHRYCVQRRALNLYIMLTLEVFMNNNSENKRKEKLETRILSSKGSGLLDYELLELILYSVCEKGESREVAERLIDLFGSLGKVINADLYELKSVAGMNDTAVASIMCVKETVNRILRGKLKKLPIMDNIEKLLEYLKATMGQLRMA